MSKWHMVFSHGRTFEIFGLFWIPAVLTSSFPTFPRLLHKSHSSPSPPPLKGDWSSVTLLFPIGSFETRLLSSACEGC